MEIIIYLCNLKNIIMKNIHVLPTDKPSRVAYNFSKLILNSKLLSPVLYKTQHIYITSNDRPKRYDYFLNGKGKIIKSSSDHSICDHKKIILTTDQDLINDGVQSIDDEFLEWFIKNPSCEEVEVMFACRGFNGAIPNLIPIGEYKIIIPKEELINCKHCDGDGIYITADSERVECPMCEKGKTPKEELQRGITITHVGKQETLEEVAERLYPIYDRFKYDEDWVEDVTKSRQDFKKGYKLAQERMYSEEEVFNLLMELSSGTPHSIAKWFEQFKKK